jgi:hypothetical protein
MAWRVGMKVERVSGPNHSEGMVIGGVYTIRSILEPKITDSFDGVGLRFVEVSCGVNPFTEIEMAYDSIHFRPLVERKTDISTLTSIADGSKRIQIADPYDVFTDVPVDAETLRAFDRAMAEAYPSRQPDYIERNRK